MLGRFDEFSYGMNKRDYVKTLRSQIGRHNYRNAFRSSYYIFDIEPASKKMKLEDKVNFQIEINKDMKKRKRGTYRGNIAASIFVSPTEKNPPQLTRIAKNLLDLFGKPLTETNLKKNGLIYFDDSQIRYLKFSCFEFSDNTNKDAKIMASFSPFLAFYEDIKLAKSIADELRDEDRYEDDFYKRNRYSDDESEMEAELEQLFMRSLGMEGYRDMLLAQKSIDQFEYLDKQKMSLQSIYYALMIGEGDGKGDIEKILGMLHPLLDIEITDLPTNDGESRSFEQKISKILESYKNKKPLLSDLYHKVNLQVLYQPPYDLKKTTIKDLDNMMIIIVKSFNKIFGPVRRPQKDKSVKNTENCVSDYEILRLNKNIENKNGFIKIGISTSDSSCWSEITRYIEKGGFLIGK